MKREDHLRGDKSMEFFETCCVQRTNTQQEPWPMRKYGEGPNPCWCCGAASHSCFMCALRKDGKCVVCGSIGHMSKDCSQWYHPLPRYTNRPRMQANHMAVIYPTISPSSFEIPKPVLDLPPSLEEIKPTLNVSDRSAAPCSAPVQGAALCGAAPTSSNNLSGVTASLSTLARAALKDSRSSTVMTTGPVSTAATSAVVTQQWPGLWGRLAKSFLPQTLERLFPLHDPRLVRQLQYAITVTGKPANALLDPGATHSFVKRSWVIEYSLQPTTLSSPSQVNSFNGQSTTLTQVLYAALGLGASSRAWAFYLVDQSPKDVVLSLDVMLQWPLFLDPIDGSIYFSSSQDKLALTRPIKASKPAKSAQFILQQALTTCHQPELSTAELPFLQDWMSSSQGNDLPPNFCTVAHSCFRPSSSFCPLPVLGSPHKAFSFSSPLSSPCVVPRLLSVTASGEAEEKEFTDFFTKASPQLQKVVKDHLSIFCYGTRPNWCYTKSRKKYDSIKDQTDIGDCPNLERSPEIRWFESSLQRIFTGKSPETR